jgi:hypothetical protein
MKRYYWSGISNDERTKAISEITGIVNRYATILNFQRFSDISLNLVLEVEECRLNDLQISLKNIMSIEGIDTNLTDSKTDCIVLINITFTQSTGDMKIEVPNIPE